MNLLEIEKLSETITKTSTKCPHCGHTVWIFNRYKKVICNWCGRYVFKNKKDEFVYRMKELKKKEEKNG